MINFDETYADQGWIETPYETAIYVSNSEGSDENDGLSPESPLATLGAGKERMQHRSNAALLLKRGDEWQEGFGAWKTGGIVGQYQVIGAYGEGDQNPIVQSNSGFTIFGGGGTPSDLEWICVRDIVFRPEPSYDGTSNSYGVSILFRVNNVLIQGCDFDGFANNIIIQGDSFENPHQDVRVHRCRVANCFNTDISNGLYVVNTLRTVITESFFDSNGYNNELGFSGTIFNHNIYIDVNNRNVIVVGNVSARASSHGIQMRCAGTCKNNLFIDNSIHALFAGNGNTGSFEGNVCIGGKNINEQDLRGHGLWLENFSSNLDAPVVRQNIFSRQTAGGFPIAVNVRNLDRFVFTENIVWDWGGPIIIENNLNSEFSFNEVTNAGTLISLFDNNNISSTRNRFLSLNPTQEWMQVDFQPIDYVSWRALTNDVGSRRLRTAGYRKPTVNIRDFGRTIEKPYWSWDDLYDNYEDMYSGFSEWNDDIRGKKIIEHFREGYRR